MKFFIKSFINLSCIVYCSFPSQSSEAEGAATPPTTSSSGLQLPPPDMSKVQHVKPKIPRSALSPMAVSMEDFATPLCRIAIPSQHGVKEETTKKVLFSMQQRICEANPVAAKWFTYVQDNYGYFLRRWVSVKVR